MYRRWCSSLILMLSLAALTACSGCTTCQSCDDYCGSYYGGRVGDWVHESGRAGSVYSHASVVEGEFVEGEVVTEIVEDMPDDGYYP